MSLNVNSQVSGHARAVRLPALARAEDTRAFLGGMPNASDHYELLKRPENFAGTCNTS